MSLKSAGTSAAFLCCVTLMLLNSVDAQSARERRDQPSEKQLQARAEKAEETLLKELTEIAAELQKQGQKEQCLAILEKIDRLNPQTPGLRDRMSAIREEMLSENGISVDLDTSKGWVGPLAEVESGKPFRIAASGEYKLNLSATMPLTGIPTADPGKDPISEAPFGALIGLIVTDGKPGAPFPVNAGLEMTPKKSGMLFLRVNVPLTAKCTGSLKIQFSGGIKPVAIRR